jgi:DNA-binding transcriptional ArsR family regulator
VKRRGLGRDRRAHHAELDAGRGSAQSTTISPILDTMPAILSHALTGICLPRHVEGVDAFAVLAEPTRRRILDELRRSESSVGRLVTALAISQPALSKHLRVLRDAGFVSCRTAAQQRIYRVEAAPLRAVDGWLAPYRRLWHHHLDALERHLENREES